MAKKRRRGQSTPAPQETKRQPTPADQEILPENYSTPQASPVAVTGETEVEVARLSQEVKAYTRLLTIFGSLALVAVSTQLAYTLSISSSVGALSGIPADMKAVEDKQSDLSTEIKTAKVDISHQIADLEKQMPNKADVAELERIQKAISASESSLKDMITKLGDLTKLQGTVAEVLEKVATKEEITTAIKDAEKRLVSATTQQMEGVEARVYGRIQKVADRIPATPATLTVFLTKPAGERKEGKLQGYVFAYPDALAGLPFPNGAAPVGITLGTPEDFPYQLAATASVDAKDLQITVFALGQVESGSLVDELVFSKSRIKATVELAPLAPNVVEPAKNAQR